MSDPVRCHYDAFPYPQIGVIASIRRCDTYSLNLTSLWARFNGELLPPDSQRILLAGCGTFSPYPFSIANPESQITALDLSEVSLKKARLRLLLHGCRNVATVAGDLLSPRIAAGQYHFIDAFGVIHHLDNPAAGLAALADRLADGGILRLMVYSKGARGDIEAIRRALRLLGIKDVSTARRLLARAPAGSRAGSCFCSLSEARTENGFADAFLHPSARTYRIDELLAMAEKAGLTPLLFAHPGAVKDVGAETERLRQEERSGGVYYNYVVYLGKRPRGTAPPEKESLLFLNPVLRRGMGMFGLRTLRIDPRLGCENPPIANAARRFLRRFRDPVAVESLSGNDVDRAMTYFDPLFIVTFRSKKNESHREPDVI
ncbi:bifunctional 2-polyprenyl-6-hydroxyphenol methylase/3-demethylubiquinol 3-O-methyltransferase UbiG [Geobacter sp. OR-1]|uniref:class I SAM-dependent methyltransferase n=1 Tax=Geobacter sp. OR-1 TaxID=1266765 RepID=UPI0005AA67E4|nr:class I SAM-dependent methyltransferase [Geobacter sp. OR-1]